MTILIYVLFLHWIGDFMLQSRWMANNKSHDLSALGCHVWLYTAMLGSGVFITGRYERIDFVWFCGVNALLHFTTDFFTSKATSYLWKKERVKDFFSVVGFDQFLHTVALIVTVQKWLKV